MFTHLVFRTDISLGADSASKQQRGFGGCVGGGCQAAVAELEVWKALVVCVCWGVEGVLRKHKHRFISSP